MVEKKFLTVAPFECAWRNDLKFQQAGRGCVAFDAFAHNDVTVVFRENVGSQQYHYRRDNCPHYTVIIGSNRNSRFKIEVNGKGVVDIKNIDLCCSTAFQSYWISIYDGLISVGKGRYPFQNLVFQWRDTNPNCSVQYVGLSSWDTHVGYRNVSVLPLTQNHISLWKQVDCKGYKGVEEGEEEEDEWEKLRTHSSDWGLGNFLESWELSDVFFVVGEEEWTIPAHKIILQASGNFPLSSSDENVIPLPGVTYPVLHALLQYLYTGQTKISELQLGSLLALSSQFEVMPLMKQCEETVQRFKLNKNLLDSGKHVELSYPNSRPHCGTTFPSSFPIKSETLKELYSTGKYSDLRIYIEGEGLIALPHKIILSIWSVPFAKMFTNGMSESHSAEVCLRDVSSESVKAMLEFMYSGELNIEDKVGFGTILLELLLVADQFEVNPLHQECCKLFLEGLTEDSVSSVLLAVSSIPSCKLVEEMCKQKFAMNFDYCATTSLEFVLLDETNFCDIIKHPELTVTFEERVLNAVLMWCIKAKELCGWEEVDELIVSIKPELLLNERLQSLNNLLQFVRLPLLPYMTLKKLENSNLCRHVYVLHDLVTEAINYLELGSSMLGSDQNVRFQHRQSSFKELQYICDGDSNGVLYFAGTSYGDHQWVNPVLAKRITIVASSPTSRFTDPKALASRTYVGTSFAGHRIEDGTTSSWWMVDIGENHELMCNYYTLRQDGSRAYIRSWKFQGSIDGKTWTDLRVHENDQRMCKPGQFASWPVAGPNALLPLRFFRVILTAPTADVSNPWNFCICFFELYGCFH